MTVVQVTKEQLAAIFESHFQTVALGLCAANPQIPAQLMWETIAEAMGNVLSQATQGPDIAGVLAARGHLGDIVNKAIRKKYPAVTAVPANAMPLPN